MFTFDKLKFYELWKTISAQEGKHKRNAPFLRQRGEEADQMWERLSKMWVRGIPEGSTVPVFLNNPRVNSIFTRAELPILLEKGVTLIYK